MIRLILSLVFLVFTVGCAGIPKIKYSQIQFSQDEESVDYGTDGKENLITLIRNMRGARYGDLIFNRSTSVLWIIPEIHKIDLDLTAQEVQLSQEEYQRRLKKLKAFHNKSLIFSIDLRMPLYPKWTQDELIAFLKENLVVALENGSSSHLPEKTTFRPLERYQEKELQNLLSGNKKKLEVSITIRAYFDRGVGDNQIITSATKRIALKLQLKYPPPYNIGYFDEKLFQGYVWTIVQEI